MVGAICNRNDRTPLTSVLAVVTQGPAVVGGGDLPVSYRADSEFIIGDADRSSTAALSA